EVARLYNSIPPEEQMKVQALMSIWIKNPDTQDRDVLGEIMDMMSEEAQRRGLTPEILADILADES
ncbi:MAG TPA: hypothetical protein VJZ27_09410, partial [Aggregatilineales bacterium]|nr:hypothetical protein [Aggregatilineales bacterium]